MNGPPMSKTVFAVASVFFLWLVTTVVFWVGYAGTDDLFYTRYAFFFHRPPISWWEFRLPAVLAIRGSFAALGPSEFAAALPMLLSSLLILASVAWQVGWLNRPGWESTLALILACTLPLDVGYRSLPVAGFVAAGLLILGSVCILRGKTRGPLLGSVLFAAGFLTHEISFFYVAIFCFTLLAFAPRRFWKPVALCVVISGSLFVVEGLTYYMLLGDFFSRFRTASTATLIPQIGFDPDTGISGAAFWLWPLQNLFFWKAFGIDLILLLAAGIVAWKRLELEQRILLCATFGLYFWVGYGTMVPWAYRPFGRQVHLYLPVAFGVASLLPFALARAWEARVWVARSIAIFAVFVHLLALAAGGRWGQGVEVSRELLDYAVRHPGQVFLTDVLTMNHMYVLGGFQLPNNVVCLNGRAVEWHLLVNKEPPGVSRFTFPERKIDGILVNLEGASQVPYEEEFSNFLSEHRGDRLQVAPVRYRLLFAPLVPFLEPRDFMVRSLGGEVVRVASGPGENRVANLASVSRGRSLPAMNAAL